MAEKRRGLGRGISALIPTAPVENTDRNENGRPVDVFFPEENDNGDSTVPVEGRGAGGAQVARSVRARSTSAASSEPTAAPAPAERSTTNVQDDSDADADAVSDASLRPVPGARFAEIPVEQITPNSKQPRQVFDEDDLEELTASIREVGLLQPIVVRPRPEADVARGEATYELVMGERRWRATQRADLPTIPAVVRTTTDDDLLRDALLENLHRAQLNPLEEASAYQQLLDDFACTHDELARRLARSRPQISNTLRLLKLPPLVQRRVASGVLSAGHARALLGLTDAAAMERLAQRIVAEGLSVRSTEEIVAIGDEPAEPEMRRRKRESPYAENLQRLSTRLADRFDTRVKVTMGARKGRISIEFAGQDDLERILETLAPGDRGLEEPALDAQ